MNDLISKQAAIDTVAEGLNRVFVESRDIAEKMISKIPSAEPTEGHYEDCTEFMEWLIDAVTNEYKWQSYKDVYGEIICRKLKELGLIKEVDGYYCSLVQNPIH